MNRTAGIVCECIKDKSGVEVMPIIKDAGFSSIFTGKTKQDKVFEIKNAADKLGLEVEFIHAPFKGINNLWLNGVDYWGIKNQILESIDSAHDNDIPTIILHVSSGWHPPQVCDEGFRRYDDIVEYAQKKNVIVAFENLRKISNLACLMDRYENVENVKYCYDCGHEYCYTAVVPMLDLYGDRIICTHLHDNFGFFPEQDGDIHLLPFDGTLDYQTMVDKLDEKGYTGSLMLEVFNGTRPEYLSMSAEEFIKEAYRRYERINALSRK